jgi:hypothetical protein
MQLAINFIKQTFGDLSQVLIRFFADFTQQSRYSIILKLSLLFIFSFTDSEHALDIPLKILALYMIISNRLFLDKSLWLILMLFHLLILFLQWDYIDNHKYISIYWLLACYLSLYSSKPLEHLQFNAKVLIGTVFIVATFQKIIGGQYTDGSFLHFTFITDGRFEIPIGLWADLPMNLLPENQAAMDDLRSFPNIVQDIKLHTANSIKHLARFVSYWTLIVEFLIGFLFLYSIKSDRLRQFKDYVLMYFMLSTYSIVMVSGFNYLLILLGFSQTIEKQKSASTLYIIGLMIFEARQIPWLKYISYIVRAFQ